MTKQVLLIHGAGGGAYEADASLAESLRAALGPAYRVRYPKMPNEDDVDYETWKRIILDEVRDMGAPAMLVGHSVGASVLIKLFSEPGEKPPIGGLFLASSPFWHDDEFWHWDEAKLASDAAQHVPRDIPLFFYHGMADDFVPAAHVDMLAKLFPQAIVRRLPGRDHQLNNDLSDVARDIQASA